jgi:signal transduction histidine kinase/ligand-binding sensor domain-containing protein/DNA-binding response OmpR family regulator
MKRVTLRLIQITVLLLLTKNTFSIQTKNINYSVEHGLSQSTVNSILQDKFGQMWFGTRNGLNLFNGYEFEIFLHSPTDTNSIINNEITCLFQLDSFNILVGTRNGICKLNILTKKSHSYNYEILGYKEFVVNDILEDNQGRIWVAAREGIFIYNKDLDNFESYSKINAPTSAVTTIVNDNKGNLWLGTGNGLFFLDKNDEWQIVKKFLYNPGGSQENQITSICFDRYNNLWAGTRQNGVFWINREDKYRIKHFFAGTKPKENLISDEIRDIIEDTKGRIWIGTKEGVNIYDPFSNEISLIKSKIGVINSISQNSVYTLFEDQQGGIWVGTWSGGVNLLQVDYNSFLPVTQFYDGENSGPIGAVSSIAELEGLYWIGTENNGIIVMDKEWNTIKTLNIKNTNNRLRSNHIKKLYKDHNNNLLIGFYDRGIQIYSSKTGKITDQVDHLNIYDITEYPNNNYWVATRRQFIRINPQEGIQKTFKYRGKQESTNQQAGASLLVSTNNTLWTGSRFGLDAFSISNEESFMHFDLSDFPSGNYSMHIFSLAEDTLGTLWIGTSQGLYYIKYSSDTAIRFGSDNLKQYIIYAIIPHKNALWLSTNNGLIKYYPESGEMNKFTILDGLQSNEFIRNSFYAGSEGYFIFGGINGFNAFIRDMDLEKKRQVQILVTKIEFNNKAGVLEKIFYPGYTEEKIIELPSGQSRVTFEFTGIDYLLSENINYAYKLDGLINEWKNNGPQNSISLNNLKSGIYTFRVKAVDENNLDLGNESIVEFRILRPIYGNFWAFLTYIILAFIALIIMWKFAVQKRSFQNELKLGKLEHEKLNQLNELKTRFFMNVSHEFRTPLTVIHGPIERMVETEDYRLGKDEAHTLLRNTKRLINLLDQLLELRKVEKGKSKMKLEYLDLNLFAKDVIQLFRTIAYEKNISIEFISNSSVYIWADRDKMEKIISNLLSNAIKFTSENGKILIEISENEDPMNEEGNIEFNVIDNGIGMNEEEINNIFDRFETLDKKGNNPKGIGIGLSLTKELVLMHHGKIHVDSKIDKGSAFTLVLPKGKELYENDENIIFVEESVVNNTTEDFISQQENIKKEKPTILIVDDNLDIRNYVSGILSEYRLIHAESVEEAETMLERNMPDLIISDIILPGKDGYEFCKQIKSEQHTSHIPVILMSAKGNDDNRIYGLEQGADAFIPKPFSTRILKVWVEKLIASRRQMFDYYMNHIMYNAKKSTNNKVSMKDSFLETAKKIIEKDIANPQLSVEMLSKQMSMSRSNLHLKFKAIINQTPSDFIRIIRLNHAAQLLISGDYNVVEAAYGAGFNSPSYFTKCFKQYFKKTPSDFIESNKAV